MYVDGVMKKVKICLGIGRMGVRILEGGGGVEMVSWKKLIEWARVIRVVGCL